LCFIARINLTKEHFVEKVEYFVRLFPIWLNMEIKVVRSSPQPSGHAPWAFQSLIQRFTVYELYKQGLFISSH
jgi:hypothetical protein